MYSVSSSKSMSHSCRAWPVSKALSGILNKFILSDFPKVETQISIGLLVLLVPLFGIIFFLMPGLICPMLLIIFFFLFRL